MKELKEIIFGRVATELEAYRSMGSGYTEKEKEMQMARFCSAFQIIEEAGLEEEYYAWKAGRA